MRADCVSAVQSCPQPIHLRYAEGTAIILLSSFAEEVFVFVASYYIEGLSSISPACKSGTLSPGP